MRPWGKGKSLAIAVTGGHTLLFGYLTASGDERFYRDFLMPVARYAIPDGESAHNLSVKACQFKMVPSWQSQSERLKTEVLGMKFKTPLGLAAGFDKNGEAIAGVYKMGFSFAEVGSVTPLPQAGNAKPRVFRLEEDRAIINRYGFNNHGHKIVFRNIKNAFFFRLGPLGVNLGANKTSPNVIDDYVQGLVAFQEVADFYVINVSSPNTAGLRSMQQNDKLRALLTA
ncbi:hypothetical protein RvY_15020-2 [Ramazzottius varieornatus]|nr:hypothetical protein RvY_15020-2 [Ramazzottius varieornatus]